MVKNVQVLRCFAAFAVVFRHTLMWFGADPGHGFLYVGRVGVDVFFVISGFIMFHTTRDFARTTREYWVDRLVRVGPPYWLASSVMSAMWFAGLPAGNLTRVCGRDVALDFLFVPHLRCDGDGNPILSVGWTLNYEIYFYVLFGLLFFLRSQLKTLVVLLFVFTSGSVLHHALRLSHTASAYLQPITLEFVAGGALALLYRRPLKLARAWARPTGIASMVLGVVVALVAAAVFKERTAEPIAIRTLVFGVPATMIVAGALLLEKVGVVAESSILLFFGAASYSVYLAHSLVVQGVALAYRALGFADRVPAVVGWGVALLASALVGSAFHLWVEKPLVAMMRKLLHRNRFEEAQPLAT